MLYPGNSRGDSWGSSASKNGNSAFRAVSRIEKKLADVRLDLLESQEFATEGGHPGDVTDDALTLKIKELQEKREKLLLQKLQREGGAPS